MPARQLVTTWTLSPARLPFSYRLKHDGRRAPVHVVEITGHPGQSAQNNRAAERKLVTTGTDSGHFCHFSQKRSQRERGHVPVASALGPHASAVRNEPAMGVMPANGPVRTPAVAGEREPVYGSAVRQERIALVDLLDRVLAGGVVVAGEVTLSIAEVDMVTISLRALVTSVSALAEHGIDLEELNR